MNAVLEILHHGALCTVQDGGRPGQRHLGIPPAGALDRAALALANRLLDNSRHAPALECLVGTRLRALAPVQVALAGRDHARAWVLAPGACIEITPDWPGVWHYLALPGGIAAPHWLGSASVCVRAGIGAPLRHGDRVSAQAAALSAWPPGIRGRYLAEPAPHDALSIRVWPGPQWAQFSAQARKSLCAQTWQISRQSDRSGYRLEGEPLPVPDRELFSEPVRIGAIQVPPDGRPIVCLNDGPTVGGYPKIGVIDPDDLHRVVQTRPGAPVRFRIAT